MSDDRTLQAYGRNAQRYAELIRTCEDDPQLAAFIGAMSPGAHVLDLGCGPGWAAAAMAAKGLKVEATDAVEKMVEMAARHAGVSARLATFDDLSVTDAYEGIWAHFSLLHAPRADLPRHLACVRRALNTGGLFHIGMKTGTGERRDDLGRFYTYYTEQELNGLLLEAGFTPFSSQTGCDAGLSGKAENWITIASHG